MPANKGLKTMTTVVANELNIIKRACTQQGWWAQGGGQWFDPCTNYRLSTSYVYGEGTVRVHNDKMEQVGFYRGNNPMTWALNTLPKIFGEDMRVALTGAIPPRSV